MTDQDLKKFKEVVKEEVKPLHGEMALIKQKLTDLNINYLKLSTKIDQNTRELASLDSNIDSLKESIQEFKDWTGEEFGKVNIKLDDLLEHKQQTHKRLQKLESPKAAA